MNHQDIKDPIVFRTVRTYKHPYLYDRHSNLVVMLSEDEYDELARVERGELLAQDSPVVCEYMEQGFLQPNIVRKIEHPMSAVIERYLETRIEQLTLQVTQQCNLRCAYCIYSGIYLRRRTHAAARMGFETAKKAIDFYIERSSSLSDAVIGFYGGEPLLEFDLIKKCVAYAKTRVEGKRIRFAMTTNGTLLTDEIADYLAENDFMLSVSIDGSKKEHDSNRRFASGEGSFDTIMGNLERIRTRHPDYWKQILFLTTINPHMDLGCVLEYFDAEDVFNDSHIIFNSMVTASLDSSSDYSDEYYAVRNFEYMKMMFALVGKLDKKHVSRLMQNSMSEYRRRVAALRNGSEISPQEHHGGPCLPGVKRLFVRTDGELFPCERVSDSLDFYNIGSLSNGFDLDKVRSVLNIGYISQDECKACWGLRRCSICSAEMEFDESPGKAAKEAACSKSIGRMDLELYELCALSEFMDEMDEEDEEDGTERLGITAYADAIDDTDRWEGCI